MRARYGSIGLMLAGLLAMGCGGGSSPTQPAAAPTLTCVSSDSRPLAWGSSPGVLVSDGLCREYRAHVPPSYDSSRALPLVVALHGYTGDPASMESFSGLSGTADAHGFLVVYPAGRNNAWDLSIGGIDVRFLRNLVASIETRANVDRRRVYVTGHSMGGAMTARAACDLADLFAAAAPVSGGHPEYNRCSPQRSISILAIHGDADPVVPPEGLPGSGWPPISVWVPAWAARDHCSATPVVSDRGVMVESVWSDCADGSEVRLEMVKGLGHGWWSQAGDDLWRFFASHSL